MPLERARKTDENIRPCISDILLDIRPRFGYIRRISLIEGRFLGASYKAERVRRLRADSQPAPGRLRASFTPVLRPVREVQSLDWDRKGRVTPAWTASQEAWPGAEPGGDSPGESRSGAPEGERASVNSPLPRPAHRHVVTQAGVARTKRTCAFRRFAPLGLSRGCAKNQTNLGRASHRENDEHFASKKYSLLPRSGGEGRREQCERRGGGC
jgi:hypothetical protein